METIFNIVYTLIGIGVLMIVAYFFLYYLPSYKVQLLMDFFTKELIEFGRGLHTRWPWWIPQKNTLTDTRAEIIVTSGGVFAMSWDKFIEKKIYENLTPRIYEAMGEVPLYGTWASAIRVREGYLETFILQTPQVAATMAIAEIDIAISDFLTGKIPEDALGMKKYINEDILAELFGGPEEEDISPFEETYGVVMSNPRLFDLNMGKKAQEASEELFATRKFKKSIEEFKPVLGENGDINKAVEDVLLNHKKINKNIFKIEDLENSIKSISQAFFKKK